MSDTQQTGAQQPTKGDLVARGIMGAVIGLSGLATVLSVVYFGFPHPTTNEAALLTVLAVIAALEVRLVQRSMPKKEVAQ